MNPSRAPGWKAIIPLWTAFAGYAVWLFIFGPYRTLKAAAGGARLPEEGFGFTGGDLYLFAEKLDDAGLAAYGIFQLADLLNAVLMSFAFAAAIWALSSRVRETGRLGLLALVPFLTGIFDASENALVISAIRNLPLKYYGVAEAAGTFGLLKAVSWISSAVILVGLAASAVFKEIRKRSRDGS